MSDARKKSFPYWVFALPLSFVLFVSVATNALDLDEDIIIPTMVMTCISVGIIGVVRARQGRSIFRSAHWGWFIACPVLLLVTLAIFDELEVSEGVYFPALLFTLIATVVVFTKKPDFDEVESDEYDIDARVEQLVAARMAEAGIGGQKQSGLLTVTACVFGLSLLGGGLVFQHEARLDRERLFESSESDWRQIVADSERASRFAMREVQRAERAASRGAEEMARLELHHVAAEFSEHALALESEPSKTREKLAETKLRLSEALAEESAQVEVAQRKAKEAQVAAQEKIRHIIRQAIRGKIELDIESVSANEHGIEVRVVHNNEPMVAKLNSNGCVIESVNEAMTGGEQLVVQVDASSDCEDGKCELKEDDCPDCEASSQATSIASTKAGSAVAKAEADAGDWNENRSDWNEIAAVLHEALFEEGLKTKGTVQLNVNDSDEELAEWAQCQDKPRPSWTMDGNDLRGEKHRIVAITGPFETQNECLRERDRQVELAMADYASSQVDGYISVPKERLKEFITDEYYGIHASSTEGVGELPIIYSLIEVDEKFREKLIETHRRQAVSMTRMAQTGFGSFGLLGVLASVFGYLKLDEKSAGQKRRRLKLGATSIAAVTVVLAGTAIMLAQQYF